ncbi:hypothetical protein DUI87_29552 [Hirundo rustica rustica]|uniref:NIPBL protein n=1 Tax=Hirundo rustica rustica TaxID=333673 RepID=A0A3M0IYZ5_HIRRU|nr:hypothetical protein DUI87_29552 [Hirundo rustica rustica]
MSVSDCREGSENGPGSAQWGPAMRQEEWAGTDAQEVPPEHEEELLCAVTEHWNRLPRESVESPLLEIFQTHLDTILCHVLWDDPAGTGRFFRNVHDATYPNFGTCVNFSVSQSMVKDKKKERKPSSDEETESDSNSGSESKSEEEASKPRRLRKRVNSDSDSDEENDINAVMKCLPENSAPLIEFANVSQGILLLLMLKQHLKNLCGFSDSKIQKYSPSESAKVYDKAINRKTGVHFHPKQTLDFLRSDMANSKITEEVKRSIVKQYLDFKLLMEHLDPDEEEEDGEVSASTNARNKAITSLLGGGSPKNNAAETEDDESDGEDRGGGTSGSLRRSKRNSDSTELAAQMNESVDVMDVIAICCPKYKDRPQIARVVQKTSNGFSVQWMAGSYSGSWTEAKRRDGRKLVPWVDTIKESDIIYKKIALTSANKLTNKVVQNLRSLYAAKDGTSS